MANARSKTQRQLAAIAVQRDELLQKIFELNRDEKALERLGIQASDSYGADFGAEVMVRVKATFKLATTIKHPSGALAVPDTIRVAAAVVVFGSSEASAVARTWLQELTEITPPNPEQDVFRRHIEANQQVAEISPFTEVSGLASKHLEAADRRRTNIANQPQILSPHEFRRQQRKAMLNLTPPTPKSPPPSPHTPPAKTSAPKPPAARVTPTGSTRLGSHATDVELSKPLRPQTTMARRPTDSVSSAIAAAKGDLESEHLTFFVGHGGRGETQKRANHRLRLNAVLREITHPGHLQTMVTAPIAPDELQRIVELTQHQLARIEALSGQDVTPKPTWADIPTPAAEDAGLDL